ncbi:glycosyltransferase [candidate division KSB1 bacterium]|nr:glycosyltransferase [candidate division KSB1 bacterium]
MKICDLTQAFIPNNGGGIRTYIENKRQYLKEKTDWQHILIYPGIEDQHSKNGAFSDYQVAAPFAPGQKPYRFMLRYDKVFSILENEQPDIIELGSPYLLPWVAFQFRKYNPCTVLGFYHTDYPAAYVHQYLKSRIGTLSAGLAEKIAYQYVKFVYSRCDATITASHIFRDKLEKLKIPDVYYIPLGVDIDTFNPSQRNEDLRKAWKCTDDDVALVYSGRFTDEKRLDVLISAYRHLKNNPRYHLILVGDGPDRPRLTALAANDDRFHVLPYQSNRGDLARILASSDIYVTAGPHETFGVSVAEAQACGLPVVGVDAGALRERIPETVGVLTPINDARQMAENIYKLSTNGFRAKGKAGRTLVASQYSWNAVFSQLFQLYDAFHSTNLYHTLNMQRAHAIKTKQQLKSIRFSENLS